MHPGLYAPREQRSHRHVVPCSAEQTTHLQAGSGASGNGEAWLAHTARSPRGRLGRDAVGPAVDSGAKSRHSARGRELPDAPGPQATARLCAGRCWGALRAWVPATYSSSPQVGKSSSGAWDPGPEGRKGRSHSSNPAAKASCWPSVSGTRSVLQKNPAVAIQMGIKGHPGLSGLGTDKAVSFPPWQRVLR